MSRMGGSGPGTRLPVLHSQCICRELDHWWNSEVSACVGYQDHRQQFHPLCHSSSPRRACERGRALGSEMLSTFPKATHIFEQWSLVSILIFLPPGILPAQNRGSELSPVRPPFAAGLSRACRLSTFLGCLPRVSRVKEVSRKNACPTVSCWSYVLLQSPAASNLGHTS